MPNATAKGFQWAYINEVTPGTTPSSALQLLRTTGGGANLNPSVEESDELHLNEIADAIRNGVDPKGTINFKPSYGAIDDFLAAIHGSDWSSNVLMVGSTKKTMTIEQQLTAAGLYVPWKHCLIEKVMINFQQGSAPTGSIEFFSAAPPTALATSSAGTGSATAAPTNRVMSSTRSIQVAQEGGSGSLLAGAPGLTSVSFEFTRTSIKGPQLGTLAFAHADPDLFSLKVNFTCYISAKTIIDKMLADTETSLSFTIGDSADKKYNFLVTRGGFLSGGLSDISRGGSFTQQYQIQSLSDATNTSSKITRTPPA